MLHYFNPGHEAAILNGSPYYHAPANVVQMQRDLAFLPAWYAGVGDYVWTVDPLPEDFLQFWSPLKDFSVKDIGGNSPSVDYAQLAKQEVALWGISPQAVHCFESISEKYTLSLDIPKWNPLYAEFSHRQKAAQYLGKLCDSFSFISPKLIPRSCESLEEIDAILEREGDILFLAKAPYSSSGRGLLWLPKGKLTRVERQILHGHLNKQKSVSLEYALQKELDFAMEFRCDGVGGCFFDGYSLFETSEKGNYLGNKILSQEQIVDILTEKIPLEYLQLAQGKLVALFSSDLAFTHKGYVGVDMMVYVENGESKLHPCVEINLRTNMGVLSIALQKNYVHPDASGDFFVEFLRSTDKLIAKHTRLLKAHPAIFTDGKMRSGYFPLCPLNAESKYLAYLFLQ
ncbi:MAG: hypothetical protein H6Q14_1012 [Bacteroidetes bacterium]|nr:hypothetical protein [Bacteroidota bacterium]